MTRAVARGPHSPPSTAGADAMVRRLRGIFPGIVETDPYTLALYGEEGIVVDVMPTGDLRIALFYTRWDDPHTPWPSSQPWRDVPGAANLDDDALRKLLMEAVNARRRQYRRCFYCGERIAPEHYLPEERACHGCGTRYHGIVY